MKAQHFFTHEIFLTKKKIGIEEWRVLFCELLRLGGVFSKWQIVISVINHQIRFYLQTPYNLPATINKMSSFLFKATVLPLIPPAQSRFRPFIRHGNLIELIDYASVHRYGDLRYATINFRALSYENFYAKTQLYFFKEGEYILRQSFAQSPSELLSLDFVASKSFTCKTQPKYTETSKILEFLHNDSDLAMFSIDVFPYLTKQHFLRLSDYDFDKHSLVLGSSGTGKSKFLSSFITNLYQDQALRPKYKVVVIDPHASLENDVGKLGQVIDFLEPTRSIDPFSNVTSDINSSSELLLDLFKTLLAEQYNSKLERVLRHSVYLLLANQSLNCFSLRRLLTDLEYRNILVKNPKNNLPMSIINFFLSDFNELRTRSYSEAISPIIAFLDEMEMVPVFSQTDFTNNLTETINQNFLTLFSLDRIKLGTKVTQTIAGLIMEQLLMIAESSKCSKHVILIIDEVAVVENPILARLLSEARKYNMSLMLVGQFFNQFSSGLQNSVFANVVNYYLFRLSRLEATLLADCLDFKISTDETRNSKIKILSELDSRKCMTRISINGKLFPAFRANTPNFVPLTGDNYG
ncbi:DUF87 domain-containing protein [Candidatus Saccharibacteria bacterium]|nr:DUF87 domain-containing protein [Candidatus Saccharibacteria bacterium]